ncbi:MAG TPA: hypothetical protein ENH55_10790 [Aurantimonas coralicida]|uniref:Uncharacterized protein n=2 Tax=root TaxID=1 RepID=A0A9C9NCV9_9HYPH|nr:hypothetical protein [Aurantimonas coralicida]HET99451.1 hypothetical protein [Aurantimonas coralicida]
MPPSGSDPETVAAIHRYIYAQYMDRIPLDRTDILWRGPIYEVLFAITLIVFFFAVVFLMRPTFHQRAAITELTSFAGQLTERAGELRLFSALSWLAVVAYAAYFAVSAVLYGIVY